MYLKEFLDDCTARGLSSQTIATYKSNIRHFLEVTGKDPRDIQMNDFRFFLGHLRTMTYKVGHQARVGVAPATMNAYFSAIGSFYEFMEWENMLMLIWFRSSGSDIFALSIREMETIPGN